MHSKLTVMFNMRKPIKLLTIYQRYSKLPALDAVPGFMVLGPRAFAEADVIVLENLSDIETSRCEHLALALLWTYGLGKILVSKKDMEAFMQQPSVDTEAAMLHFAPAINGKAIGVQVKDELAQSLGCLYLI